MNDQPDPTETFFATEEPFFREFAREFTLDPAVTYFMAGQKGSMPRSVMARFKAGLDQIAADPFPVHVEASADIRATIARCYGTTPDQIAITRNTTDALALIFNGIEWQPGDEILISPLEHPSGITAALRTAARHGVVLRQWGVPTHAQATVEEVVAAFERRLVPGKTRAVFFSSPVWPLGQRMPERLLAQAAQRAGALTIVDGAHYNGMIDPQLDATGVDFFALCGHKWQCGPGGTGVLYIRNRMLAANATPLPRFHIIRSQAREFPFDGSRGDWDIGQALTTYGFPESADWRALADACRRWDEVGRARIQQWHLSLGDYLRARIAQTFGPSSLLGAQRDPALKSGIVAFNPFESEAHRSDLAMNLAFRERLLSEYRFRISGKGVGDDGIIRQPDARARAFAPGTIPNLHPDTLEPAPMAHPHRVNACVWNHRAQIDAFVAAAQELVGRMMRSR
ncbi:MAG: aminotransferase class V-fold PLP-dependent enzyme [Burkholderiaceae bacterium]